MTNIETQSVKLWLKAFIPPLVWAGVIFAFSAQTSLHGAELSTIDFVMKKTAHMFVYCVLYLLFHRAFQLTMPAKSGFWVWVIPLVLCFGYAISDEIHQSFVPGRYASSRDIGYDMLGAAIAWLKIYRYI